MSCTTSRGTGVGRNARTERRVVIALGETRDEACERMLRALQGLVCEGVPTTVAMHRAILSSPEFRAGDYDTRAIPGFPR
jgi:acetyl-CoA carboxylase biotin carboxylase subunit